MGYNGSNRKGYDVRYRGFPKSSKRFADRIEANILMFGLGIGASFLSSSKPKPQKQKVQQPVFSQILEKSAGDLSAAKPKESVKKIPIWPLILAPMFQALSYVSYAYWGFWTFFSLLIFSTIATVCVIISFMNANYYTASWSNGRMGYFIATVVSAVLTLGLSLWPLLVGDHEIRTISYILLAFEDIILVASSIALCRD